MKIPFCCRPRFEFSTQLSSCRSLSVLHLTLQLSYLGFRDFVFVVVGAVPEIVPAEKGNWSELWLKGGK